MYETHRGQIPIQRMANQDGVTGKQRLQLPETDEGRGSEMDEMGWDE